MNYRYAGSNRDRKKQIGIIRGNQVAELLQSICSNTDALKGGGYWPVIKGLNRICWIVPSHPQAQELMNRWLREKGII